MTKLNKEAYVTTYEPVSGYKAVLMVWDEDVQTHLPWNTGLTAYATKAEAVKEAKAWAEAEGLDYVEN
jgi:hypothetical protein